MWHIYKKKIHTTKEKQDKFVISLESLYDCFLFARREVISSTNFPRFRTYTIESQERAQMYYKKINTRDTLDTMLITRPKKQILYTMPNKYEIVSGGYRKIYINTNHNKKYVLYAAKIVYENYDDDDI